MLRRIGLPLLWILTWIGLFFWWVSSWPAQVSLPDDGGDLLWRTIQKKNNWWERGVFSGDKNDQLVSYQEGKFVLYGQGNAPEIKKVKDWFEIELKPWSWIIRSLDEPQKISFQSPWIPGVLTGVGGVYIDTQNKIVANFDADMTVSGSKLLPSFLIRDGKSEFFDIAEQKDLIPSDLWLAYTTFFPRDQAKVLGNISKKFLDTMIRTLIDREPESSVWSFFRSDLRVRNALEEIQSLVGKIDAGESCWVDSSSCFTLLSEIIHREKPQFPDVFTPLEHALQAWMQLDTGVQDAEYSWASIFRTYHMQLLHGDARARVTRDKWILAMIRSWNTTSSLEVWNYLTQMLASQKLWSAYSLQIVREMIRIGDILQRSPDISEETRKALGKNAIESLTNLKNILENTYFTQKEYWFVLRDDLVDSDGKTIKNQVFINDLQELIKQVDSSVLIQSSRGNDDNLRIIRAQLIWFNCIFSRNDEYVNNPRICRTTKTETKE